MMVTGVLRIAAFGAATGFTGFGGTSRTVLVGHPVRPGVAPGATYPRHIGTARCRRGGGRSAEQD